MLEINDIYITFLVSNSLEKFLDCQPPTLEIITYARTAKWNLLGVQLQLDSVNLAECYDYTSMYQLWLQEKAENATRRNLLTALRAIGQNNVARKYEDYLRTEVSFYDIKFIYIYIYIYAMLMNVRST